MSALILAKLADITPAWIAAVAGALAREGNAYDLSADAQSILVHSINTGQWMPLNLPSGGHRFATAEDGRATYTAIFAEVLRMQIGQCEVCAGPSQPGSVCDDCVERSRNG